LRWAGKQIGILNSFCNEDQSLFLHSSSDYFFAMQNLDEEQIEERVRCSSLGCNNFEDERKKYDV